MDSKQKIQQHLSFLYGEQHAELLTEQLWEKLTAFQEIYSAPEYRGPSHRLSEMDAILISYGDMVQRNGDKPLKVMAEFLNTHLEGVINIVHILPFFPYSSDDGFSVIDYKQVNPNWGDWSDVKNIANHFDLMFDVVVNHISQFSKWFEEYKKGNPDYANYFITIDPGTDLSDVFRPRALPLLTKVDTVSGEKWVWTTFSADQIDLNFANPAVLFEVLAIFLFYISQGARCIRLDAIAFIWKEIGTNCLHLPQVHCIVELIRTVLDVVAPHVVLITETNVPHEENISYFGDGKNEAQMVYNFSLPPLVLHSIQTGDGEKLMRWAKTLEQKTDQVTFFNFLASHDGIGLLPARGILNDDEINALAEHTLAMGGRVSYKNNSDGSKTPYEMNINYLDATRPADKEESVEKIANRFLASQSIMMALRGVPGIYYHSLLGSQNWVEGMVASRQNRTINREKLDVDLLNQELKDSKSLRHFVFEGFKKFLCVRQNHSAFDPHGGQEVIDQNPAVFGVKRISRDQAENIICLTNVSNEPQVVFLDNDDMPENWMSLGDLLGSGFSFQRGGSLHVELAPYQVCWLLIK
ncbi:MAG: sugar phosphorylase [Anaerolineaceae bacterium]|nr:sugar phosphorylase [Anaerolineaceae bacterium]